MHEVKIFFPAVKRDGTLYIRVEKMLMPNKSRSGGSFNQKDLLEALRRRGTIHSIDSQLDIHEDSDHSGGNLYVSDVITGDRICSLMW